MLPRGGHRDMVLEVTELVHADRKDAAAGVFADFCKMGSLSPKESVWNEVLLTLYHWLLNNRGMEEAAQLLWSPRLFNPNPRCSQQVWNLFDTSNQALIMGAASMSKSYTMGVRLFLEWSRDPRYTTVSLVGPSEQHLQRNLFSHLVRLHKNSSLPMPGEVGDLFIGLDRRDQGSSISGVIIPLGQSKKAGRLQGSKCFPRPVQHPIFGWMSRYFVFLDEIENVPEGVWSDIDNILSNLTDDPNRGLKIFGAYNPLNPAAEVAKRAEPPFGWKDLNPDVHFRWKSTRGWDVLRLDAMTCENVISGETIYHGLQTRAGISRISRNAGGTQSAGYLAQVRAMYPSGGTILSVFPPSLVDRMKGEFIWYEEPFHAAGIDLALEGSAAAVLAKGSFGTATGVIRPPSVQFPNGHREMFRDKSGLIVPRYALQLDALIPLPKGNTQAMYETIVRSCRTLSIKPTNVCVDRTGNGAGVHDLLRDQWDLSVRGVNYSESASDQRIMSEDLQAPKEEFKRACSELWFALKKWAEFGFIVIHPSVDTIKLNEQLKGRQYRLGKQSEVESKQTYIGRGKLSPDEADAFSLLVHSIRMTHSIVLSMTDDPAYAPDPEGGSSDFSRVDPTNEFESLEFDVF